MPWLSLLEDGSIGQHNPEQPPVSYMCQPEWTECLKKAVQEKDRDNWFAWLQLGLNTFIEKDSHKAFTPEMDEYLHLEYGKPQPCNSFPAKELMSKVGLPEDTSNTYLFLPLHVGEDILGYVILINRFDVLFQPDAMYMWTRHLSQDLERVRQNVRMKELNKMLTEVSMTDALTGLKNRAGYDSLAVPYLQKCQLEGKLGTMIFADINRMKLINDKYGHLP